MKTLIIFIICFFITNVSYSGVSTYVNPNILDDSGSVYIDYNINPESSRMFESITDYYMSLPGNPVHSGFNFARFPSDVNKIFAEARYGVKEDVNGGKLNYFDDFIIWSEPVEIISFEYGYFEPITFDLKVSGLDGPTNKLNFDINEGSSTEKSLLYIDNLKYKPVVTPEPATILLLGGGFAGAIWRRRKDSKV